MKPIERELSREILRAARAFPAVILTGPRRAGKTWLVRRLFPKAEYHLLEDPDVIGRVRSDPRAFLESLRPPVILDEIQNAPQLFGYIRTIVDRQPRKMGQWVLTGSQEAPLMQGVSESMAGRAAVLQLLPLSCRELKKIDLVRGGFPEIYERPRAARQWFASYVQTYLERDLRQVNAIQDLATFRRFLAVLASRHGQLLRQTELAAPLGVSVPTIARWINVLEITGQILVVPPYFENFGKRLLKMPKIYFVDSGLVCHLLGIDTLKMLEQSVFTGAVFEGFLAAEIVKNQVNRGARKELYYFRDQQGLEIDFVVPRPGGTLSLVEVKYTRTPKPAMARPLTQLTDEHIQRPVQRLLVFRGPGSPGGSTAILPGVKALTADEFLAGA
jgi:uncharacterized protein